MGLVALGGIGAALVVMSTPVGLIEMIVASSGMTEVLPSAAPPLGFTARLLMAAFAAVMAMGLIVATRRDRAVNQEKTRTRNAQGARKMGFALSKLAAIARGRVATPANQDGPFLRRADAHPDAPARAPIFASRDFGGLDIFARTDPGYRELVVQAEPDHDPIVPSTGLTMPSAPAPMPEAVFTQPTFARPPAPTPFAREDVDVAAPRETMSPIVVEVRTQPLSVAELTERLERALALRGDPATAIAPGSPLADLPPADLPVIADLPVAPAVPVRPAVADDVDEALSAALGTLRSMTARAR